MTRIAIYALAKASQTGGFPTIPQACQLVSTQLPQRQPAGFKSHPQREREFCVDTYSQTSIVAVSRGRCRIDLTSVIHWRLTLHAGAREKPVVRRDR
jgi:hypothetical protein